MRKCPRRQPDGASVEPYHIGWTYHARCANVYIHTPHTHVWYNTRDVGVRCLVMVATIKMPSVGCIRHGAIISWLYSTGLESRRAVDSTPRIRPLNRAHVPCVGNPSRAQVHREAQIVSFRIQARGLGATRNVSRYELFAALTPAQRARPQLAQSRVRTRDTANQRDTFTRPTCNPRGPPHHGLHEEAGRDGAAILITQSHIVVL